MHPAGRARCVRLTPRAIINTAGSRPRERLKFNVIYYFLIYPNETFYADIFDAPDPPSSSPPGPGHSRGWETRVCALDTARVKRGFWRVNVFFRFITRSPGVSPRIEKGVTTINARREYEIAYSKARTADHNRVINRKDLLLKRLHFIRLFFFAFLFAFNY